MQGQITECRPTGNQYGTDGSFRLPNGMRISCSFFDLMCDIGLIDISKDVDWDYDWE